jgi:hypothetical protein
MYVGSKPEGGVLMEGPRPNDTAKASEEGTWINDPMDEWKKEMEELDKETIPRWFEDHLVDDHKGITDSPFLQEKLDRKLLKRAQKPNT